MKKDYSVALRGHHLMLLYIFLFSGGAARIWEFLFFRYGYGEKHAQHAVRVLKKIKRSNTKTKITDVLDAICEKCKLEKPKCRNPKKTGKDVAIAKYVGLKIGNIYTSKYIIRKLKVLDEKEFIEFYCQRF